MLAKSLITFVIKMKYVTPALAVLFFITCNIKQKTKTPGIYDDNFELLNCRVKQIVEINKGQYSGIDTTTIDFDRSGHISQMKRKGNCDCSIKYEYKYGKNRKPRELIVTNLGRVQGLNHQIFNYDTSGRIVQSWYFSKELRENSDTSLKRNRLFYKYNPTGSLIEESLYLDSEHLLLVKYKYDSRNLLVEDDRFFHDERIPHEETYNYLSVDKNGNWLVRTSSDRDTVSRKIIYY